MKFSKKSIGTFIAGITALALIAGSMAFYSSEHSIDNTMKTETPGGDVMQETFTPNLEWKPGDKATKEVGVTNTGDYDLVVRIKLEETWARADSPANKFITLNSGSTKFLPASATSSTQTDEDDGLTTNDSSVVFKEMTTGNWIKDGEWYYYKNVLGSGETTGSLLKSITLCSDADMGATVTEKYYTSSATLKNTAPVEGTNTSTNAASHATKWIKMGTNDAPPTDIGTVYTYSVSGISTTAQGYSNGQYDLLITAQTCSAKEDAVTAQWGSDAAGLSGNNWNLQ